jgi:hypothetical protein
MSESGFASLGPTLLARKGGAKPAMRPQIAPLMADEAQIAALADEQLEDLGWNDMGEAEAEDGGEVVPINAAAAAYNAAAASPIVHRQQRRLEQRLLADAVMTGPEDESGEAFDEAEDFAAEADCAAAADAAPVARAPATPRSARRAPTAGSERRAAFTLRLDRERHLKLRLAATIRGMSAQALVTEALDALLAHFDELDTIAAHLKRH